jgi:hypothetical protein
MFIVLHNSPFLIVCCFQLNYITFCVYVVLGLEPKTLIQDRQALYHWATEPHRQPYTIILKPKYKERNQIVLLNLNVIHAFKTIIVICFLDDSHSDRVRWNCWQDARNLLKLLVEMQTSISSMEVGMEGHQKAKNRPTLWPCYATLGHISRGLWLNV